MKRTKTPLQEKLMTAHDIQKDIAKWKLKGLSICFTNGCFDILHLGHITYLSKAALLADVLIVGVNSDRSVKALNKAPDRPVNNEEARAALIASLEAVDAVFVFDENTPKELISKLLPDVLVKGGDYDPEEQDSGHPRYVVGRESVLKSGGSVKTIELVEGFSTTEILKKIQS
ncbi:MAG: adenylyltransferase/cytidyltransferase family protein [Crocinitomicaceae bacterium]|jgi:rfaE bifunctional protein nucleotidyltransferase chain/domain|tara:strand:- start:1143 stop:1661 length:519 start_codon:yes stop_codon:yes gene_type:complete